MNGSRSVRALVWLSALVACGLFAGQAIAATVENPGLKAEDCVKCHAAPPADIAAAGGKHKSDVTCLDCHAGHRPASKNNIPKCSSCHDGAPHYQEKGCLDCHKNPHKPLNIVFHAKVTDPCLACHKEQISQLKENRSKHSALFCSRCHDVHRKVPNCVDCHKPHSAEMTQADCSKCHKAHQPTVLTYGVDIPNKDCGACHKKAIGLLSATETKHKNVACVRCHQNRHKTVPACEQCHPKKHPAAITKKFSKCGTCHYTAHDLYGWPDAQAPAKEKAAATQAAPKKGPKK